MHILDTRGPELHIGQIRDPRAFWQKLREKTDPMFIFLHSALPVPTKGQLAKGEPTNLETAIVEALNHIIRGKSIYEPERFRRFKLRPETKDLTSKSEALDSDQSKRLNRLLLEDSLETN